MAIAGQFSLTVAANDNNVKNGKIEESHENWEHSFDIIPDVSLPSMPIFSLNVVLMILRSFVHQYSLSISGSVQLHKHYGVILRLMII